jgi:microcystin-dependent protein
MGRTLGTDTYVIANPDASMAPTAVTAVGGSQPHTNFQPYLCVSFIISLFGIFPSPT